MEGRRSKQSWRQARASPPRFQAVGDMEPFGALAGELGLAAYTAEHLALVGSIHIPARKGEQPVTGLNRDMASYSYIHTRMDSGTRTGTHKGTSNHQ